MTLNSVVLPAPFGPISACNRRSASARLAPATAAKPPKRLLTGAAFEQRRGGAGSAGPPQESGTGGRGSVRSRAAIAAESASGGLALRNGGQEARAEADQAHTGENRMNAMNRSPSRNGQAAVCDGEELAEQDEEQGAERRAQEIAHAADHGHGDDLARERHVDHVRRDEK